MLLSWLVEYARKIYVIRNSFKFLDEFNFLENLHLMGDKELKDKLKSIVIMK